MHSYHLWTIGCQMNKADSAELAEGLERLGYRPAATAEEADLVVLNTCAVRQSAENRALSKLGALRPLKDRNPSLVIALAGCMVDSQTQELRHRFPQVDLFLRPGEFADLLAAARERSPEQAAGDATSAPPPATAFLTAIEGCDNFCSYCIVPYRRGRERSHPPGELLRQVDSLVHRGAREVTLLGQNVNSYGHDLPGSPDLAHLLSEISTVEGLARLRYLTSHPRDITPRFIEALARLDKVCEHISLPVQAGDDAILEAMGRGYTVAQYRELVTRLRQAVPNLAIATDVIVGFPGETEEQFQATVDLLAELRFDTVHVAAYSPRPGTLAARRLEDSVPFAEKRRRLRVVEEMQEAIATEKNADLLGRTVEVLVEGQRKGKWEGRTRAGKLVFFPDPLDRRGQLVEVRIEKASPWALQGVLAAS